MLDLKPTLCALVIAGSLMPTVAAQAATYYVATTGNNGNPGTESQPWRAVAHAVATMVPGDTTYVRGGTYKEGLIRFGKSGTQGNPIKLLNYPGESPIIDFIDANQFHRIVLQHNSGSQNAIGWITIAGFELRNGSDGIKIYNGHDLTIQRNWIHDAKISQGIVGNGTRILIDRNRISHNGNFAGCATTPSECNKDHGIYMNGTGITITNNIIYDNLSFGIQATGTVSYNSASHAGPEYALSHNWVIANNTIAYQVNRAAIVVWGSYLKNLRIENNIFYENGVKLASGDPQGIDFVSANSTGVTIRNNLSYGSGSGATAFIASWAIEGVQYTQSGNIVNGSNPLFVKAPSTLPASPNFALAPGSPAIDAGLTLAAVRVDINGTSRPQGTAHDIGAHEYNASGDVQPPDAPTRLSVQ